MSLAEMIKPKGYLLENASDYIHGMDNDTVKVDPLNPIEELHSGSGIDGNYYDADIYGETLNKQTSDVHSEVKFEEGEEGGEEAGNGTSNCIFLHPNPDE